MRSIAPAASDSITRFWSGRVSLGCLLLFALLAAMVHARLLAGVDLAAAQAKGAVVGGPLDLWSSVTSVLLSAEFSVVYGIAASVLLWRAGLGWWSLAPLTFLLIVAVEFALKLTLQQPVVPAEFRRESTYPLITVTLNGSFPSGHAARSSFLFTFLAMVLWRRDGLAARLASLATIPLVVMLGFARIYMGYHWLSDVVAGLLLGAAVALLVAPPVVRRLAWRRGGSRTAPTRSASGPTYSGR